MNLITYKDYKLQITPEAYSIRAFKRLHDSDTSADKDYAMSVFSYLYFMYHPASDFIRFVDLEERKEEIEAQIGIEIDEEDTLIAKAVLTFKHIIGSAELDFLEDSIETVHNLRKFLKNIDYSETDDKGKLVYQPAQVAGVLRTIPVIVNDLLKAKQLAIKGIESGEGKARGNRIQTVTDRGVDQFFEQSEIENDGPSD